MANKVRLIDASALDSKLEALAKKYEANGRTEVAKDYYFIQTVLMTAPTVDAVEVVHGEWIRNEDGEYYWYTCSECAEYPMRDRWGEEKLTNYCPYCGAKMMDGERREGE